MRNPHRLCSGLLLALLLSLTACQGARSKSEEKPPVRQDVGPGSSDLVANDKAPQSEPDVAGATAEVPSTESDAAPSKPPEEAPTAKTCRALVDVAVQGEGGKTEYRVVELRSAAEGAVFADRPGLIWHDGDRFVGLRLVHHRADKAIKEEWDVLEGVDLPAGTEKVWVTTRGEVGTYEPDGMEMEFYEESALTVTALVGPFVSASVEAIGFSGGAHENNDSRTMTLGADGRRVAVAELLDAEALAEVERALAKADAQRTADGSFDEPLPRFQPDAINASLGWVSAPGGGQRLAVSSLLSCCSWAENHNLFSLEAALPEVPSKLAPHLKLNGAGRFVGPEGCEPLAAQSGALVYGDGGSAQRWTGASVTGILGVYWLDEAAPNGLLESMPPAAAEVVEVDDGPSAGAPQIVLSEPVVPEGKHFPAVSADGTQVALWVVDRDGARGEPNGTLQLRQVADNRVLEQVVILSPDESEEAGEGLAALLVERVSKANAVLDATKWHPMLALQPITEQAGPYNEGPLARGTVQIALDEPGFKIWRGKQEVFSKAFAEWSVDNSEPIYPECNPEEEECFCENPAYLETSWTDAGEHVLLVEVSYYGTDRCWEPSPRLHVMPIPE